METLYLYRITPKEDDDHYDTYDSAIVCAKSKEDAKTICPSEFLFNSGWVDSPNDVDAELIGVSLATVTRGVILASFNAG